VITEKRLEEALKFLAETDEQQAKGSANVKYLDRLLKRKKALFITGDILIKLLLMNYLKQKSRQVLLTTKETKKR
jgi:hypothetical protein